MAIRQLLRDLLPEPRASEADCQRTIIDAARLSGWLVYHNRTAQQGQRYLTALSGHQGFPDLVLVHARARLVWFVELKRHPNRLTPPQESWGQALTQAGADYHVVWVPEEQDEFCQLLADQQNLRARVRPTTTVIIHDPGLFDLEAE